MATRVVVAGGAGDAAAGAIGIGAIEPGRAFASLGTSGQLLVASDRHRPNVATLVHAYCHGVPERWFQMAAMLNGAAPLAFAARLLGRDDVDALIGETEAAFRGPSPLLALPYLAGERTPHNDPFATGVVFGLTGATAPTDVVQAFMEGVAFTFADALDALGPAIDGVDRIGFIGGGARSRLWGRMIASVLGLPLVRYTESDLWPAVGAARLGFVAAGAGLAETCAEPPIADLIEPDPALATAYRPRIEAWRALYRSLRNNFRSATAKGGAS
jgi:xylulokinase